MKHKTALAALGLMALSALAIADVVTPTAQALPPAPLDLSTLISFAHPFFALVLGCLLSTEGHVLLEGAISFIPNPIVRIAAKLAIGSIGAGVTAFFGQKFGVSATDAAAAWTGVLGFLPTVKIFLTQAKALGLTTDIKADVAKVGQAALSPSGITEIASIANAAGHPGLANVIREYGAALAATPGNAAVPATVKMGVPSLSGNAENPSPTTPPALAQAPTSQVPAVPAAAPASAASTLPPAEPGQPSAS